MCGIIGLVNANPDSHVNQALVDALTMLQHRGQDAAGIVTCHRNRLNMRKDNGTVAEVFTQESVVNLQGNIGIGHVRYPTAGGSCSAEAQPFYTNYPFGIALAHNGNLTNMAELSGQMRNVFRHINTGSDSELLLNLFADELQRRQLTFITPNDIFDAVRIVMRKCRGSYAVVILINRIGLLAFRDPYGIRPLCFGKRKSSHGYDYAIASESVAIDSLDPLFKLERDVGPGEAIFISMQGQFLNRHILPSPTFAPCLFEYVYFARPDSILDGVKVYDARIGMGEKLATRIVDVLGEEHDIDVVMPIPETSRTAALQCAHVLNRPYREGFVKNRYIARTFIMPGQEVRRKTVRLKLNTVRSEFLGRNVLLIDDSIVRGTTSIELIQMAREAGAKKVYFASAAPPVRYPNVYGIDIPTRTELVAHNREESDISSVLGADCVIYNTLSDISACVSSLAGGAFRQLEDSCFSGRYVTEDITDQYLSTLEASRGDGRKIHSASPAILVIPNANSTAVNNIQGKRFNNGEYKSNQKSDMGGIQEESDNIVYNLSSDEVINISNGDYGYMNDMNQDMEKLALQNLVESLPTPVPRRPSSDILLHQSESPLQFPPGTYEDRNHGIAYEHHSATMSVSSTATMDMSGISSASPRRQNSAGGHNVTSTTGCEPIYNHAPSARIN